MLQKLVSLILRRPPFAKTGAESKAVSREDIAYS
jgi:hypothetical protein